MLSRAARLRLVRLARKVVEKINICRTNAPSGVSSTFVKVTESFGARVTRWADKSEVLATFRMHVAAFQAGIAPYAFCFMEFYDKCGRKMYGYLVQTVQVLNEYIHRNDLYPEVNDYSGRDGRTGIKLIDNQGSRLHKRIKNVLDISLQDTHFGNVGLIGTKLVCIDFGMEGHSS